jgi:DNA-binding transcriptional regulator PaaX
MHMSLVKEILRITAGHYPLGYSELYKKLYSVAKRDGNKLNKDSLSSTLSRMKAKGLLKRNEDAWTITPEGKELLVDPKSSIKRFFPSKRNRSGKVPSSLIVIFDIPEKKRRYRDWLRSELVGFGFEQIQKSVWFGPPLPEEFIRYIEMEGLIKCIRFFKATEGDVI